MFFFSKRRAHVDILDLSGGSDLDHSLTDCLTQVNVVPKMENVAKFLSRVRI